MGNAPLDHEVCGHVLNLELCARTTVLDQEGQRTLKLEEQITQLFDELRQPIRRYLLCLNVSPMEAEEIIQDTFLRLYRHLHSGGREDNLRGWIFRVAHNIGINELKRRKYVGPSNPREGASLGELRIDPAPNPEELLLRKERMVRTHAAISALSDRQKQCLYLRAEGFRYREIAELLGITVSTVAELLHRAIKKLTEESNGQSG
jgi:RNA polymerase sigma-70 factor (ECF subfamily)